MEHRAGNNRLDVPSGRQYPARQGCSIGSRGQSSKSRISSAVCTASRPISRSRRAEFRCDGTPDVDDRDRRAPGVEYGRRRPGGELLVLPVAQGELGPADLGELTLELLTVGGVVLAPAGRRSGADPGRPCPARLRLLTRAKPVKGAKPDSYGRLAGTRHAYTNDTEATYGGSIGPGPTASSGRGGSSWGEMARVLSTGERNWRSRGQGAASAA
jgi:hypothetical protein